MTASADRLAAALADRYRIERELGQGGLTLSPVHLPPLPAGRAWHS